jgi:hypothetical protein
MRHMTLISAIHQHYAWPYPIGTFKLKNLLTWYISISVTSNKIYIV